MRKKGMFKNILKNNMIIFVIPFVLFSMFVIHVATDYTSRQVNDAELLLLKQINQQYSNALEKAITVSNMFYYNSEVNHALSTEKGDDYETLVDQKDVAEIYTNNIGNFNDYVQCLNVFGFDGTVYTNDTELKATEADIKQLFDEEWYKNADKDNSGIIYVNNEESDVLKRMYPDTPIHLIRIMKNLNSGRIIGLMDIELRENLLWSIVENNFSNQKQMIVLDEYGVVIDSSEQTDMSETLKKENYYSKLENYKSGYFLVNHNKTDMQVSFVTNDYSGIKIILYEPYKLAWGEKILAFSILACIVYLIYVVLMSVYSAKQYCRPIYALKNSVLAVKEGNLKERTPVVNREDEFGELAVEFNMMVERINSLIELLKQEEKKKGLLEMQALQAQINPHFLYNTLASIRFLADMGEYQQVNVALLSLVKLLKQSYSDNRKIISVEEEIEMLKNYLQIMQIRYSTEFECRFYNMQEISDSQILRMTLQPLVENCILHGFGNRGKGHIWINAKRSDGKVLITIADDGSGANIDEMNRILDGASKEMEKKDCLNGIGIFNVHKRIQNEFGREFGLKVEQRKKRGLLVQVILPYRKIL